MIDVGNGRFSELQPSKSRYNVKEISTIKKDQCSEINYSIGQELSAAMGKGKKRKIGRNINVQPTAMARRIFRSRGKGAARTGRRIQDQESGKRQIVLDENDDENVYFSLPKQKKRKTRQKHSLKNSVDENRPNSKKH